MEHATKGYRVPVEATPPSLSSNTDTVPAMAIFPGSCNREGTSVNGP